MADSVRLSDLGCKSRKSFEVPSDLVAHVLEEYQRVTRDDLAEGIAWYVGAGELAANLASGTAYTPNQIGAVISAMSPRMPWGRNKTVARRIVERHAAGNTDVTGLGLWDNVRLSYRILDGADPATELKNKRLNFWLNIMGREDIATIDSWMCKVIFGRDTDIQAANDYHDLCSQIIEVAAEVAGIPPRSFQAALWVMVRREMLTDNELANYESEGM